MRNDDGPPIIDLFSGMGKLEALYLDLDSIDSQVLNGIIRNCSKLKYLHVIAEPFDWLPVYQIQFMLLHLLSKRFIESICPSFRVNVPNGITAVDLFTTNVNEIDLVSEIYREYMENADDELEVACISTIVSFDSSDVDKIRSISKYLHRDNMPDWSRIKSLERIKLVSKGFEVEVPKPAEKGIEGEQDQETRNEIQVMVHDYTYILGTLKPLDKYHMAVTVSKKCPVYTGDFLPEGQHFDMYRAMYTNVFVPLLETKTIRKLHFEVSKVFENFLETIKKEDLNEESFPDLYLLSGQIDVLDMSIIPFKSFNKISRPQLIYLEVTSNLTKGVDLKEAEGYALDQDASMCREALGRRAPSNGKEFCFHMVDSVRTR